MPSSIECGIYKGELPALVPVLKNWQDIVNKTATAWKKEADDAPWWYNERASLSLLAGAIWLNNGRAFEEFSVYRKQVTRRGVDFQTGRCDIEFQLKRQYYIAEAKQCWPTLGQSKQNAISLVRAYTDQAKSEVAQVWQRGYRSLAVVFVVPRIPISHASNLEENVLDSSGN